MITTKWNHRYNIGIIPIWDYINHGKQYHISIIPMYRRFYICIYYAFITCGGFSLYIGFIVANVLTDFLILTYILLGSPLYNKFRFSVTQPITYKSTYKKKYLWITTKWNHRNNIGIYPIIGLYQSWNNNTI